MNGVTGNDSTTPAPRAGKPSAGELSKPEAQRRLVTLKKQVGVAAVLGFGAFSALAARHGLSTAALTSTASTTQQVSPSGPQQQAPSSQTSQGGDFNQGQGNVDQGQGGFFSQGQGGYGFGNGSVAPGPVAGTGAS